MVVKRSTRQARPVKVGKRVQAQPVPVPQPVQLNPVMIRVTMVGPLGMEEDLIIAAKKVFADTGVRVRFNMEELDPTPTTEVIPAIQSSNGSGAVRTVLPAPGRSVADQRPSRRAPTANFGRNAVVYQVVDRRALQTIPSNSTRGAVASFILQRGNAYPSAREIAEGTGVRLKPVEGAIHALRTDGVIQSIQAS